jgi:hypothetical protein
MSAYPDAWAAGPAAPIPPLPPRPDVVPTIAPATTSSYATAETWKRVGAVLGVVWAFFFFLTIPGWIALSRYRKWKRGESTTPFGLIWWGYGFGALFVFGMVVSSFS